MAVSTLFATMASTETLDGTSLGVTVCSSPPCPIFPKKVRGRNNSYTQIVPFSKRKLITALHYTSKVETSMRIVSYGIEPLGFPRGGGESASASSSFSASCNESS